MPLELELEPEPEPDGDGEGACAVVGGGDDVVTVTGRSTVVTCPSEVTVCTRVSTVVRAGGELPPPRVRKYASNPPASAPAASSTSSSGQADDVRRAGGGSGRVTTVPVPATASGRVWPAASASDERSAATNSCEVEKRRAGSFASARSKQRSSSRGRFAYAEIDGTGALMCAAASAVGLS